MAYLKTNFPNGGNRSIEYGIIDALVAQGESSCQENFAGRSIAQTYNHLVNYQETNGGKMDFILLDHPVESLAEVDSAAPSSINAIRETRNFFAVNNIKVGVYLVSDFRPDTQTEKQYAKNILWYIQQLESGSIPFSYYIITSWYNIPTLELPESPAYPASLTNYSMTRNLKILSHYILSTRNSTAPAAPSDLLVN